MPMSTVNDEERSIASSATAPITRTQQTPFTSLPEKQEHATGNATPAALVLPWAGTNDSAHPHNLSCFRKWVITIIVSNGAACVASTSSIYPSADEDIQTRFGLTHEISVLGLSLFLLGLGLGPLLLAPLSEFYGRRVIYLVSYTLFVILQIPTPVAFIFKNKWALLVPRFFAALSGSAFLTVAGGTVSDMFSTESLAAPMSLFSASPFLGTIVGPVIGGFLCEQVGCAWSFWVMLFWSILVLVGVIFVVPETYTTVLIIRRAQQVRSSGTDPNYYSAPEQERAATNRTPIQAVIKSCYTPFQLLFHEPIVSMLNTWTAVLMGILYLFFAAFPKVFRNVYGFRLQLTGLTFLGIGFGMVVSLLSQPYWKRRYERAKIRNGDGGATPEMRLIPSMLGGILAPIGVGWFAGTIRDGVHWIVPILAGIPFGLGVILCFISVQAYLVDAYPLYAASALACHIFMRTTLAAIFPLFEAQMYERLGYQWASGLLAFLILIMTPLPFLFAKYGAEIRASSRFTHPQNITSGGGQVPSPQVNASPGVAESNSIADRASNVQR
ncbi:major facilitator superfamily domain-containing protein [Kalaharituber pfeilii]|nr:major facilitator superfamily domain-containing protein [Kalaharituber pfeilii]